MKVKALEIKNKDSYLIKAGWFSSSKDFFVNGIPLVDEAKRSNLILHKNDKVECLGKSRLLVGYIRGDERMSIDEFKSKPQYYDEDHTDEFVLRAIANKKELQGFVPEYKDPEPEIVQFDVQGYIEDTGSDFIECAITNSYSTKNVLYTVCLRQITLDEYSKLSKKYCKHANFEQLNRDYLRFVKINGKFVFGDYKPFKDFDYRDTFSTLEKAREAEQQTRNTVKSIVEKAVFNRKITDSKKVKVLEVLKLARELRSKESIIDMIDILISDLEEYKVYVSDFDQ